VRVTTHTPGRSALAALSVLALAGCSVAAPAATSTPGSAASAAPSAGTAPSASTSSSDAASAAPVARVQQPITGADPITLSFVGDVHFERNLAPVATDPQGMAPLKKLLSKADFTIANLESAITDGGGSPQPDKQFTFHAPSSAFTTMANAGIDVAGMANNHSGDYNTGGLKDTLAAIKKAPLKVIGIGANADEANAPLVLEKDGVTIALLNASALWEKTTEFHTASATNPGIAAVGVEARPEANARFLAAVRDAAARYDVVIPFLHYGTELETCATAKQKALVDTLRKAGADAIIGGHSHRVQAGGWLGNTYVDYGLGSFTWWMRGSDPTTGFLTISIDKARVQAKRDALAAGSAADAASVVSKEAWTPMEIGTSGLPFLVGESTAAKYLAKRDALRSCSGDLRSTP